MMTDDQLAEAVALADAAQARADAATPGPWTVVDNEWVDGGVLLCVQEIIGHDGDDRLLCSVSNYPRGTQLGDQDVANCDFAAAARDDVPALAAAVRELAAEVERLRGTDELVRLRAAASEIVEQLAASEQHVEHFGAVNWSDIDCIAAERVIDDEGCIRLRCVLSEASPESSLSSYVASRLHKDGWTSAEVACEW